MQTHACGSSARRQGIFSWVGQRAVQAKQLRPAANERNTVIENVRRKLRRRALQHGLNLLHKALQRFLQRLGNFIGVDAGPFWEGP